MYSMQSTLEDLVTEFTTMRISKTPEIVGDAYYVIRITKCEHHANTTDKLEIIYDAKEKDAFLISKHRYDAAALVTVLRDYIAHECDLLRVSIEYRCVFKVFDVYDSSFRANTRLWFSLLDFFSGDGNDGGLRANVYPVVWRFDVDLGESEEFIGHVTHACRGQ